MSESTVSLHKDIAPLSDYFVRETLHKTIESFFRSGEIIFEPGMDKGIEILIEGYLKPLKVIKQIPRGFKLHVDPGANKIVSLALEQIKGGRVSLDHLYLSLRKGDYGLSRNEFEMLALALLFSGQVRGFSSGREVNIQRPDFLTIWNIEEIGEGELLAPALREVLLACPFIPQRLKKGGFSLILQQKAWDALIEAKRAWSADEEGLLQMLRNVVGYRSLAHIDLHPLEEDYYTIRALFHEIKISYPAKEGLERFLIFYQNTPFLEDAYGRLERFREFTFHDLDIYANIFSYMTDPALVIPEEEIYCSLLSLRDEVKTILFDQERTFSEGYMDELADIFHRFKETYTLDYQAEHQRVKSRDKLAPYQRLKESPRYRLLARISQISMICVEDDLVKVNRCLAEVETMICRGLDLDQLRKRPLCQCGFKLGETVTPLPIRQIEETIDRGLVEYIETLKEPRYTEQIISYAVSLEDVGKGKEAKKLRKLLDLALHSEADITVLDNLLTDKLIKGLNEAFEGKVVIVERDIHELLENIIDRNFPKDKLISIFSEWLNQGKTLTNDVYIKIKYKVQRAKDYPMAEMVKNIFPELIPFIKDIGEDLFQRLLIACVWAKQHNLSLEGIFRAFDCHPPLDFHEHAFGEKCQKVFGSFSRQTGKQRGPFLEDTEQFILAKGISARLCDLIIKEAGEEEILGMLMHESFFVFSAREMTTLLMKRLYSERDCAKIKKMQAMMGKWMDDGARLRDKEALAAQRVDSAQYVALLNNFSRILLALEWLSDAKPCEFEAVGWEKAFIEYGARFELLTELLFKDLQDMNMVDSISIKALKKERNWFLSQFQKGFSEYIAGEYTALIAQSAPVHAFSQTQTNDDPGPRFVHSIRYRFYEKYKKKLKPAKTHFLLIDVMRWDIWDYCRHDLMGALHDTYRIVDQVPLWVFLPTTTSSQIQPFVTGEPPSPYMINDKEISSRKVMEERRAYNAGATSATKGRENSRFFELLPEEDGIFTCKYNFIDDKLHTSGEDLLTIFSEIKLNLQSSLAEYMNKLPVKSMVIIFSDHGFIKKKTFSKKGPKARLYAHGGTSPWEMIVPLVVFYKWR